MSNYTQKLQDFQQTFDAYLELDVNGYDFEKDALTHFYDENNAYFTNIEEELYWTVDGLSEVCGEYFDGIAAQEQLDEERDQKSYLGSEENS